MKSQRAELLSLDVLALSLLCCLLASVVGVLVLGEDAKTRSAQAAVGRQVDQFARMLDQTRSTLTSVAGKLDRATLDRQVSIKQSELDEIARKLEARRKIAEAQQETRRLEEQFTAATAGQAATQAASQGSPIFGSYRGGYVLIECVKDKSIVHSSGDRIGLQPTQDQIARLVNKITAAGFVLFIVRRSGWMENPDPMKNPYTSLRMRLLAALRGRLSNEGKPIPVVSVPMENDVSIDSVLSPPANP